MSRGNKSTNRSEHSARRAKLGGWSLGGLLQAGVSFFRGRLLLAMLLPVRSVRQTSQTGWVDGLLRARIILQIKLGGVGGRELIG